MSVAPWRGEWEEKLCPTMPRGKLEAGLLGSRSIGEQLLVRDNAVGERAGGSAVCCADADVEPVARAGEPIVHVVA